MILVDATIWLDGLDIQTITNQVALSYEAEAKDATTFGQSTRINKGGLFAVSGDVGYYADWSVSGSTLFDSVGATTGLLTVTPTGADTETGFSFQSVTVTNQPFGGAVGDMDAGSLKVQGRSGSPLVRGTILYPKQTQSSTDSGTAVQMGAVAATQKVYTAIHVFTAGTTCDVIVESDSQEDFAGSAETQSSTTVTAAGGTWVAPVDGAITDDWWRVRLANVTGSFSLAVVVAIQ